MSIRSWFWLAILVGLCLAIFWLWPRPSHAHMHDRPDLDEWFRSRKIPAPNGMSRIPCCSSTDEENGNLVVIEDYVTAEEFEKHHCRRSTNAESSNSKGPFEYCAYLYDQWWLVEARVVLKEANEYGQALGWLSWGWDKDNKVVSFWRCFMPIDGS